MKIGIDLDNTIVDYGPVFQLGAAEMGFSCEEKFTKNRLKSKIIEQQNGQRNWEKLQGKVYGEWIHNAKLYSGFQRFLDRALRRGCKISIISHKTEYGHQSENLISLRKSALDFLNSKGINPEKESNISISFFDNRIEKIKKINSSKLDVFIDDLLEIFEDRYFESKAEKILFDPEVIYDRNEIRCANNWDDISYYLFDEFNENELLHYAQFLLSDEISKIEIINSGINSKTAIATDGKKNKSILKIYPADSTHNRIQAESNGILMMKKSGIENVPDLLKVDHNLEIGIYEYIDGFKIKDRNLLLSEMIKFTEKLYRISKETNLVASPKASAACLTLDEVKCQLDERYRRIKNCATYEIENFLEIIYYSIEKEWNKIKAYRKNNKVNNPSKDLFLSPSDFGKHNSIRDKKNQIYFFDFEYFGIDDSAKFICDTVLHPGSNWTQKEKLCWFRAVNEIFGKETLDRAITYLPLYSLNWVLIMLNGFVKNRIRFLGKTKLRKNQLHNAFRFFEKNYLLTKKTISYG